MLAQLRREDFEEEYCQKLEKMLSKREKTAKKNILKYMSFSFPVRAIFRHAKEALRELDFRDNENWQILVRFVDDVLQT